MLQDWRLIMAKRAKVSLVALALGSLVVVGWMAAPFDYAQGPRAKSSGQEAPKPPEPPTPPAALAEPFELAPAPPMPPQAFGGIFMDGGSWLGVRLSDVTPERARELKLQGEYGAVVEEVENDSPAAKAGLAKGDVILEFAGERAWSVSQLQRIVRETPPGRTVEFKVSRDGKSRSVSVKLESHQPFARALAMAPRPRIEFSLRGVIAGPTVGISGEELTRQLAEYFGVKQGKGVLVREVVAGSAAEKAGLKAGDVIVRVESTDVGSVEDFRRALPRDLTEKRKVNVTIVRDRREQTLSVELEPTRRVTPRQAEIFGPYGIDQDEVRRLADQARRLAEQVTREKMESYRGLMENYQGQIQDYQRSLKDWQKQWQEEQRKLQEELRLKLKAFQTAGKQTI